MSDIEAKLAELRKRLDDQNVLTHDEGSALIAAVEALLVEVDMLTRTNPQRCARIRASVEAILKGVET